MQRLIAMIMVALVATGIATASTYSIYQPKKYRWMPAMWYRLAVCESGHNPPNWHHNGGSYQGAFGFWYGTWDQYKLRGYPSEAYWATPRQQYKVALRVFSIHGYGAWGCFGHSWVKYG